MSTKNKFKCPYCKKVYIQKPSLYIHMEEKHYDQLNGLSPAHDYFNKKNNKDHGTCIIDGRTTDFNEKTERYERICSDRCKQIYREQFKKRMLNKYNKITLADTDEFQKKMQSHRKIAGNYKWSNKKDVFSYLGTYELDLLRYLDTVLEMDPKDIISPAPMKIPYEFKGEQHFYMPDLYIISLNLMIEVKGTNKHYQHRDYQKEITKDKAAEKSEYNYIKVVDKDYADLIDKITELKNN